MSLRMTYMYLSRDTAKCTINYVEITPHELTNPEVTKQQLYPITIYTLDKLSQCDRAFICYKYNITIVMQFQFHPIYMYSESTEVPTLGGSTLTVYAC